MENMEAILSKEAWRNCFKLKLNFLIYFMQQLKFVQSHWQIVWIKK